MPMDEEPPRTLRQSPADQQDPESENRPDRERQPPSDVLREQRSVEERQRGEPADRRSDPVAAVDREVDAATVPGGDQLIDCRVDRRVLAADPDAGQEPEQKEVSRGAKENAVATVATRYTLSVNMNSFLRPKRSVSCPNTSAPIHAPAT